MHTRLVVTGGAAGGCAVNVLLAPNSRATA